MIEQMRKLQDPIEQRLDWARQWAGNSPPLINGAKYSKFMQLLYSSLYAFSPQGRQSGKLVFDSACILLNGDFVLFRYSRFKVEASRGADESRSFLDHQIQDGCNLRVPAGDFERDIAGAVQVVPAYLSTLCLPRAKRQRR